MSRDSVSDTQIALLMTFWQRQKFRVRVMAKQAITWAIVQLSALWDRI
jgi:hypothetical protein